MHLSVSGESIFNHGDDDVCGSGVSVTELLVPHVSMNEHDARKAKEQIERPTVEGQIQKEDNIRVRENIVEPAALHHSFQSI